MGKMKNFMMDMREKKTTIESMFRSVVEPALSGSGVNLFADNAFVSVTQCRWAMDHQINFSGTSRTTYGFPKALIDGPDAPTKKGDWYFAMTTDGLIATSWIGSYYLVPLSGATMRQPHIYTSLPGCRLQTRPWMNPSRV